MPGAPRQAHIRATPFYSTRFPAFSMERVSATVLVCIYAVSGETTAPTDEIVWSMKVPERTPATCAACMANTCLMHAHRHRAEHTGARLAREADPGAVRNPAARQVGACARSHGILFAAWLHALAGEVECSACCTSMYPAGRTPHAPRRKPHLPHIACHTVPVAFVRWHVRMIPVGDMSFAAIRNPCSRASTRFYPPPFGARQRPSSMPSPPVRPHRHRPTEQSSASASGPASAALELVRVNA